MMSECLSVLDFAKMYLGLGLSVIPIEYKGKRPLVKWKEYQKRLPTEEEITKWFNNNTVNLGIVTGSVSRNLFVIDFDNREAYLDFFNDSERREIEENTLVVNTARGVHVYLRSDKTIKCYRIEDKGFDIKGEGGYVVAPPSIHPSGVRYEFISKRYRISFAEGLCDKVLKYVMEKRNGTVNGKIKTNGDYPPCIVDMIEKLVKTGELDHEARITLATYLMSRFSDDKVIDFFKCANDFDEGKTRYQIQWLRERDYKPYSCEKLMELGLCVGKCKFFPWMFKEVVQ